MLLFLEKLQIVSKAIQHYLPDIMRDVTIDDVIVHLYSKDAIKFEEKERIEQMDGGDTDKVRYQTMKS